MSLLTYSPLRRRFCFVYKVHVTDEMGLVFISQRMAAGQQKSRLYNGKPAMG